MKKLFLFVSAVVLTVSLNSCSKSDSGSSIGGKITFNIGSQTKTFNTVVVNQEVFNGGTASEYTELTVIGTTGTSSTESVTISLYKTDVGANAISYFEYYDGVDSFADQNGTFHTNVTTNNSSKKLIGTFSGTINGPANGSPIGITNGSFNVQY